MNFIRSIFKISRSIILAAALICMVVFMVDNREVVVINMQPLPFEIQTRVFVLMIFCFIVGLVFGLIICSPVILRNFFGKIANRHKIKKLENQLKQQQDL